NYAMARDAVDRFYTRVSQDTLLNEPHMDRLRKELLELARGFYQKFVDERRTDPRARLDLGYAYIRLAHIGHTTGSETGVIGHAEEARAMLTALAAEPPGIATYRYGLAMSLNELGHLYHDTGRAKEAEGAYTRAVKEREALAAAHPEAAAYRRGLASSLNE